MVTLDSILPTLKRNEKITSRYASDGNYFRFTVGFSHVLGVIENDFVVQFEKENIWISYDFKERPDWARHAIDNFLERLKETIKIHPEVKFRAATGAIKLHVDPIVEVDDHGYEVDSKDAEPTSSELIVFFIGFLLAIASIFKIATQFHVNSLTFLVLTGIAFLVLLFAGVSVWLEGKKEWKTSQFWFFGVTGLGVIIALTALFIVILLASFIVSWIFSWLTIPAFLVCLFAFPTTVHYYEVLTEKAKKRTAKV